MGRPPKTTTDVRGTDIRVRVSSVELEEIMRAAQRAGLPISAWVRMVALREARGRR